MAQSSLFRRTNLTNPRVMRNIAPLFLLIFFTLTGNTQSADRFTIEELQEDFRFLKQSFEQYNPGLGVYHPIFEFEAVYDSLYKELNSDMTDLEFYPYLVQLAVATREGHTEVGRWADTTNNIYKGFRNGEFKYFPFSLKHLEGKAWVWGNFSPDSTLQAGDQILQINGVDIASIYEKLNRYIIADGRISSFKERKIEDGFNRYYYWFVEQPESFEIRYRPKQKEEIQTITVPAINRDSMLAWIRKRYNQGNSEESKISDVYEFEIKEEVAILKLKNFGNRLRTKLNVEPEKIYERVFQELSEKGIKHPGDRCAQ